MKIDLEPLETPADEDETNEPVVVRYPKWMRLLIWGTCVAFSMVFWWGLFLLAKALLG